MKIYILILLFLISPYFLNAQDLNPYNNIIPPNPDAASLAKYADFPVDLSTGGVQINIPLWDIKCGDIDVPISLSYHASGIPVAETPSYVGLGWALNAGGVITRTIKGLADDQMQRRGMQEGLSSIISGILTASSYAVFPDYPNSNDDGSNPFKYWSAAAGKIDLEPDMFYYNFCNFSGKFVFGSDGTAHLIPRKNIIIEKKLGSKNGRIIEWTLTADDGLKYYFNEFESSVQNTKTEGHLNNSTSLETGRLISNSSTDSEYNSAWFLTKIKMPTISDSVIFEYDDISYENTYPVSETYKVFNSCTGTSRYSKKGIHEESQTTATISGKRLRKIIAPNQTVEFIPGNYRYDLTGDRVLDSVIIRDNENEIIKQFKLSYNYFSKSAMATVGTTATSTTAAKTYYRLSLQKIQEFNKKSNNLPPYTFSYESSVWLPDRLTSKAQDHWGYYNGENNNTTLIPYLNDIDNLYSIRDASEDYMKAGSLKKLTYPTGGYTQFNYEANYYSTLITGSGLRIKEKIDYDPISGKSLFKQYDYEFPYLGYVYNYAYETSIENETYWNYTSVSNSALNNDDGPSVSYRKVTVIEGDNEIGLNGKTVNSYSILLSYNTYTNDYSYSKGDNIDLKLVWGNTGMFPFAPAISGAWGCGLLESQSFYKYKDKSFSLVKNIENTYKNNYWGHSSAYNYETDVLAVKVGIVSSARNAIGIDEYGTSRIGVQFYFIPSRNINLTKTIESDYDDNGETISKVTDIEYENSSPYIYPSKTTISLSDGNKLVEQTLYPQDYTNAGNDFIGLMKINHIINKPIEKITYKIEGSNTLITSGGIFAYKVGNNIGKIDKVFKLQTEAPISKSDFKLSNKTTTNALSDDEGTNTSFSLGGIDTRYTNKPEITFDAYDNEGNILQYHYAKKNNTCFLWSYNQSYPVVKIEGKAYADIPESIKTAITGTTFSGSTKYEDIKVDRKFICDQLTSLLSDHTCMVTYYTYAPLIGMTSQTDPNGITTYYEYDPFGRLKCIKDDDGKILKTYEYNYKQ